MKLTRARRAILQEAARHRLSSLFQPTMAQMPGCRWLEDAGLLRCYAGGIGWAPTPLGEMALSEPFGTQAEAHAAVDEWKVGHPAAHLLQGWVALRCKPSGWAVRMSFGRGPSLLLPQGIDKGLLR